MKYNTVTFGATGSQCSGNQKTVVTNVGTKEDMDLSITHDQVLVGDMCVTSACLNMVVVSL